MKTSDKILVILIGILLGLMAGLTSCSTQSKCCAYNSQLMTAKYVKHSDFAKKRYNLN